MSNKDSDFDLSTKVAVVTGGNSGIGLGFARALVRAGARVCIWGRSPSKNAQALSELNALGSDQGQVIALECDVADETAVDSAFAYTLNQFGRVDACFANAGTGSDLSRFHHMTTDSWRSTMAVNLDGAFFTLRAAAAHMVERAELGDTGGSLIGVSSLAAVCGLRRGAHYAATKGAVISLMQSLAVDYARYGITANTVLPGHIHTDMTSANYANPRFVDAVMPRIPMGRWGDPGDFGGIAVYLVSNASRYHTGDSFLIDGGFRMD